MNFCVLFVREIKWYGWISALEVNKTVIRAVSVSSDALRTVSNSKTYEYARSLPTLTMYTYTHSQTTVSTVSINSDIPFYIWCNVYACV